MSKVIKAMIVDDDTASRTILAKFLEMDNKVSVVANLKSAGEALECFEQVQPDVIFLDINLPSENGIDFALSLRKLNSLVPIVFTTAYRFFASDVVAVNPIDFLVKPFGIPEVFEVLSKVENYISENEMQDRKLWGDIIPNKMKLKTSRGYVFVNQKDILFFSICSSITRMHLTNGKVERINYTLKDLYEEIQALNFLKISRSEIINLNLLDRVETKSDLCVLRHNHIEYKFNVSRKVLKYFETLQSIRLG